MIENKNILVTGAINFLGSNLVKDLVISNYTIGIDRNEYLVNHKISKQI